MQLFQTPDTVVIFNEMNHNTRVIPLGGGSHVDLRLWAWDDGRAAGDL